MPDLTQVNLQQARDDAAIPEVDRNGRPLAAARCLLAAVAAAQAIVAVPALWTVGTSGASAHAVREAGSYSAAMAVGLLAVAWQPARAPGLLPVLFTLTVVMGGAAVVDVQAGDIGSGGETAHVLDLAGLALVWWVVRHRDTWARRSCRRAQGAWWARA